MSYLDKLLEGAQVEWKTLGDESIGKFIRGSGLQKKDFTETGVGCIHYGQIYTYYGTYTNKTKSFVSEEFAKKARKAKPGDLVIATTSENDEDVCKAVAWLGDEEIAVSSDACFYVHSLNPKYVAYFFQTEQFQKQKKPFITGTKVRRVNADDLAKITIPIPCLDNPKKSLEIQKEIVRILDSFTALTAALTAALTVELTARKQQYNFYRESLLSFEGKEVEWKTLGEIAVIGTGSHDTQDAVANGIYTFYARGITPLKLASYDFDETAIITPGDGVGVGKVFHWAVGKYALHQRAYRIVPNADVSSRYIYHYLVANFYAYILKTSVHSSVTSLRRPMFLKFPIPVPSREKQERIVTILDKFDILTTSISDALPKEIELRKKQYEYYRDLLLTFPKNNIES